MMSSLGGDKARGPREKALPASAHTSQPQKQIQVSHCIPKTTVLWNADILREKSKKTPKTNPNTTMTSNLSDDQYWKVFSFVLIAASQSCTLYCDNIKWFQTIQNKTNIWIHSLYISHTLFLIFLLVKAVQLFLCYRLLLSRSGLLRWSMTRMMLTLRGKLTRLVTLK